MGGTLLAAGKGGAQPLNVTISPYDIADYFGAGSSFTTETFTAVATGGTAPYTYAWTRISGGPRWNAAADSPATAASTFSGTGFISGLPATGVYRMTVTDALLATDTADVTVTYERS